MRRRMSRMLVRKGGCEAKGSNSWGPRQKGKNSVRWRKGKRERSMNVGNLADK
jgi:hypothetical protein